MSFGDGFGEGPKGPPGADGGAGADGKTVLTTSGAPSNGTGTNGDFAYDPTAKLMYGPKAAGVWPAPVSLAGANGTDASVTFANVNSAIATANASIAVNNQKITGLADPSASTDADTKGARDAAITARGVHVYVHDPIPVIIQQSIASRSATGPYTCGIDFGVTEDATLSWVEHYLISSGTEIYNVAFWNAAGAQLATVALSISSAGRKRFTLASPLSLTAGLKYTYGIWNSTNNAFCGQTSLITWFPATSTNPIFNGNRLVIYHTAKYASGNNTKPTTNDSKDHMPYIGGLTVP